MKEEAKKEFLEGVVSKIFVTRLGNNRFELIVHFQMPYVEDQLVKTTPIASQKTVKFTVKDGKDSIKVPLVFADMKKPRELTS